MILNTKKEQPTYLSFENDTHPGTTLDEYLKIAHAEGFEIVLKIPFDGGKEVQFFLFHRKDGILLKFDTCDDKIHSGNFYYNWIPLDANSWAGYTSSGEFFESNGQEMWSGDHGCLEFMRRNLNRLRKHGKFVTPWKKQPFLWFLNYIEAKKKNFDYKEINESVISQLPDYVRASIQAN
jgi:hypothetical protein